ncbi:MAG TPA: hypothetical protein VMT34_15205, partial [Aggregatilineales bacterium]|nr:hypothetical protein [Aggregatilineales bacterium]
AALEADPSLTITQVTKNSDRSLICWTVKALPTVTGCFMQDVTIGKPPKTHLTADLHFQPGDLHLGDLFAIYGMPLSSDQCTWAHSEQNNVHWIRFSGGIFVEAVDPASRGCAPIRPDLTVLAIDYRDSDAWIGCAWAGFSPRMTDCRFSV